jgi:hypothetical protein
MKIISILIILLFPATVFAQSTFRDISFEQAIELSAKTGKLIFLQVESADCRHCNEVANKAFEDKELRTKFEQTVICLKIGPDAADRETINKLYGVKMSFGSFFIDQNKSLIHSFPQSTTRAAEYISQIDLALYKSGEEVRVIELEKEYRAGNKTSAMLELILRKRKSLNLETDALLDEYVEILPTDSIKSLRKLAFIAQMAPVIGSPADSKLRSNYTLFNEAWFTLPLAERVAINSRINNKSIEKAIKEKNETYAYRVATFVRSTYAGDYLAGKKMYDYYLLRFYKETNNLQQYRVRAIDYYDNYFMTLSVDSIKKADSEKRNLQAANTKPSAITKSDSGSLQQRQFKQFAYAPITQNFTRDLNDAAWSFYKMFDDSTNTNKALQWSKRANEFYESPEAMDTYARLLYRSGYSSQAASWMEKAIALRKKRGFPTAESESILENIRQGKALAKD